MVWGGGDRLSRAERDQLPKRRALLGFNEPNFPERPALLGTRRLDLYDSTKYMVYIAMYVV